MEYNSGKHHRRSIRLKDCDYSSAGAYFVTICTSRKECLFGKITDGRMLLNGLGKIARDEWIKTAQIRENVKLDEYVIMPNHLHGIIVIVDDCRGTARRAPTVQRISTKESFGKPVSGSLPTIVRSCKSAITKRINELRGTPGAPVWQRNYYEHVIRDEEDLSQIREYIVNNPLKWDLDRENPSNFSDEVADC